MRTNDASEKARCLRPPSSLCPYGFVKYDQVSFRPSRRLQFFLRLELHDNQHNVSVVAGTSISPIIAVISCPDELSPLK